LISLGVLTAAIVLGLAVGVTLGVRGNAFGTGSASDQGSRPTIVLGQAASPSAIARSPVPAPTTTAPGAPPTAGPEQATEFDEYVVAPGDTMRSIAQQAYGDADLWPRIYEANRDLIGPDPNALQVGAHLRIPRQE
jgi:nucleoid-associated protein YgaU